MSSALDRDLGALLYAPKWVRDATHVERHGTAPKSQEVIEDGAAQPSDRHIVRTARTHLMREACPVHLLVSALAYSRAVPSTLQSSPFLALFVVGRFPTSWTVSAKDGKEDPPSLELQRGRMLALRNNQSRPFRNSALDRKIRARRARHFRSMPPSLVRPKAQASLSRVSPTDPQ
jgi:hypothetical protein